jgi:hypothetical protein
VDQDGTHEITEEEIKELYFPYYKSNMNKIGKGNEATFENCLEDFKVINWAYEIKDTK